MADYVRTAQDLSHSISSQLSDANGPIDLQDTDVVTFDARLVGADAPTIGGTAAVVAAGVNADHPQRGWVRYDPTEADMAVPGIYFGKFRLAGQGSPDTQSFPEGPPITVIVGPRI